MCNRYHGRYVLAAYLLLGPAALMVIGDSPAMTDMTRRGAGVSFRASEWGSLWARPKKKSLDKKTKSYRVQKGDTLYSVARKFGVKVDELRDLNSLDDEGLKAGQRIRIPSVSGDSEPAVDTEKKSAGKKRKGRKGGAVEAAARTGKPSGPRPEFRWPVAPVKGYRRDGSDSVKAIGLVITSKSGARVVSAAPGTVEKIGYMRGWGEYVILRHESGYSTVYANVEAITVREGDVVPAGRELARVSRESRIHFQIDLGGRPQDPLRHLPKS